MTIRLVSERDTLPLGTDRTFVDWRRESQPAINRALNIPTFRVHRNGTDQTAVATATYTKIQFTTRGIDSHTYWDTTNYRYLPKIAGKYLFHLSIRWNYTPGGELIAARLLKNGATVVADTAIYVDASQSNAQITTLVDMNGATDYVEFYCYQASGGPEDLIGADYHTFGEGFKVSD
jgi:hypothetical protein